MAGLGWDPAADAYHATRSLLQCTSVIEGDGKITPTKRQELTHSYSEQALVMLRKAVANGFKNSSLLKQDRGMDRLRPHPEFQRLLAELEMK
jgi:hypothetical protein